MKKTIVFHSLRIDVVSYGNGTAYAVHDNYARKSYFAQDEDASALREEWQTYEAAFPEFPIEDFFVEQIAIREE
jgi:hypothetical protein